MNRLIFTSILENEREVVCEDLVHIDTRMNFRGLIFGEGGLTELSVIS